MQWKLSSLQASKHLNNFYKLSKSSLNSRRSPALFLKPRLGCNCLSCYPLSVARFSSPSSAAMSRSSSSSSTTMSRFDGIVTHHLDDLNFGCLRFAAEFNTVTGVLHEESQDYLDIAVPPTQHANWRRDAMTFYLGELPRACAEFLLAETVEPNLRIVSAYNSVVKTVVGSLETFCGEREKFMTVLLLKLEKQIRRKIRQRDADWKIQIVKTYLSMHEHLQVERFSQMFFYLLDVCIDPPLDSELTIDVIKTLCYCDYHRLGVFNLISNAKALETVILHAKDMRFDFWGMWSGVGGLASVFDYIPYFMALYLNQEFSNILIKYGFPYMTGSAEFVKRCEHLRDTMIGDRAIIRSEYVFYKHAYTAKRTRMMLIMDTFLIFGDFEEDPGVDDRIQTLKYLNRSLPLPYVTRTELKSTMLEAVVPDFEQELESIVAKYCRSGIVEDDIEVSMPRRLVHLCRVAVRKILADNFMLLDGIKKLPIPEELKPYLELEC